MFDKHEYDNRYIKENYYRFQITIPKSKKEMLKTIAKDNGLSLSQLFIKAVEDKYDCDLSKD